MMKTGKILLGIGMVAVAGCVVCLLTNGTIPTAASIHSLPSELLAATDSTLCDESAEQPERIERLCDTAYQSAASVQYQIEILDRETPGELQDLNDPYVGSENVLMFRGSHLRNADFGGRVEGQPSKVVVDWVYITDYDKRETPYGVWGGGTGWTGQPLYVHWTPEQMERTRNSSDGLTEQFSEREIIVASLASNLYFINFDTGKASRKPLSTDNPIKGTPSLDPSMNGLLYVGQGIPNGGDIGTMTFDLYHHRLVHFFGRDAHAWRGWGAYDSSAVSVGGFIFRPSENGTLYKWICSETKQQVHSLVRYHMPNRNAPGIESSMAVYRNYGYVSDNHGNIICFNLDHLKPVWWYNNIDDTDATPVLDLEEGHPYLYVGSELDKQGSTGFSWFTKIDALTGEAVWKAPIACRKLHYAGKTREGGMFATPLLGKGNCSHLIFSSFCFAGEKDSGTFIAIDRSTGREVYRTTFKQYAWSSPVAFYDEQDRMYIFTGDIFGNVYLLDGLTGTILYTAKVGNNFESSPVVVGNSLVIGSRGREIYKMHIE